MTTFFCWGLLAFGLAVLPQTASAEPMMPRDFPLTSVSDRARYGLLIASPDAVPCSAVQFIIRDGAGVIGRTQALQAGEVQVVRIGQGFAAGEHALQIAASGCPVQSVAVRMVRLGKPSPDHGWRAAAMMQVVVAR